MNADNRLVAKVHIIFSLPITVLGIEIETELEKKIQYNRGEVCINPVHTACWRINIKNINTKNKYLNPKVYNTRCRRNVYKRGFFLSSLLLN